jgi:Sulfotransferase family
MHLQWDGRQSIVRRMSIEYRHPIWLLLARRQRLAYLQVPKSACSSMHAALALLNHPELSREEVCAWGAIQKNQHWVELVKDGDPALRGYFRFTFVREPCSRFASFFRSKVHNLTNDRIRPRFAKMGIKAGMSMDDVLDLVEKIPVAELDPHLVPQNRLVFSGEKSRVDFIGRMEKMADGLDEIAARTGTRLDPPRLNVTVGTPDRDFREPLSDRVRARLARLYAEDFTRFGYPI